MKEYIYISMLLFAITANSYSQNLVNNSSFEELNWCPHLWFDFLTVTDCFKVSGSSDIFNNCFNDSSYTGVPFNFFGEQYPRTGNSYIGQGFGLFFINLNDSTINDSIFNISEITGITLKSLLLLNVKYCVNFYVSLGNRRTNIAMDGISMLIISDSIPELHLEPLMDSVLVQYPKMEQPQINNPSGNIIEDAINWVKIEGEFIAHGDEKYLYIGNFKRLRDIHWKIIPAINQYPGSESYYYIDDVSVYPCDAPVYFADAGKDTCISAGDSVVLGNPSREEYLYWWSDGKRGIGNSGSITVSPTQTTTYYLTQKDFKFDETRDSITVTVGNCNVSPDYSGESFQIYPNPNDGNFQVRFNRLVPEGAKLQLFDMLGRQIGEYLLTGNGNIAFLSIEMAKSLYYAKVIAPDFQTKSVKIVIAE